MQLSQLNLLIDSGIPIVCVATPAGDRITILTWIYKEFAVGRNLPIYLWNSGWECFKQVKCEFKNKINFYSIKDSGFTGYYVDVFEAFDCLLNYEGDAIFVLENLPSLLDSTSEYFGNFSNKMISQLINIYYELENNGKLKYLILLTTDDAELPQSLNSLIPTLWTSLPSTEEVTDLITNYLHKFRSEVSAAIDILSLVNAASGLTIEEIRLGLAIAVRSCLELNTNTIAENLLVYKVNRFRSFNLNLLPKPSLLDFGGLDLLKKYIENAKQDFLPSARAANIPLPKGCLLVGPPGTGKTLAAHVSAKILGFPLVSIDTTVLAGAGGTYFKRLLERVEACAPVVLYFDEFDKLFAASGESGEDISSRQILGTLLTWLQDKKSAVFVVATLNRLDVLPLELTRVGRFDEIFYVGFPQAIERKAILIMHLRRFDERYYSSDILTSKEWRIILNKTINCTGAELARIVEKAARALFYQGRQMKIGLVELLEQREIMIPLYVRDTDRILAIENRAKYISQPASSPDKSEFAPTITSYWGN
jgi:ATP-dependent 26S proteasome regulatory subunit